MTAILERGGFAIVLGLMATVVNIQAASAQYEAGRAANAIYLELLGNGGLFSLNYERAIRSGPGLRIGWSYFPSIVMGEELPDHMWIPIMANVVLGSSIRKVEFGIGAIIRYQTRQQWPGRGFLQRYETATIAYRLESRSRGEMLKIAFTPIFVYPEGNSDIRYFIPSVGLSFGRVF